jgi:hypothetical protein
MFVSTRIQKTRLSPFFSINSHHVYIIATHLSCFNLLSTYYTRLVLCCISIYCGPNPIKSSKKISYLVLIGTSKPAYFTLYIE